MGTLKHSIVDGDCKHAVTRRWGRGSKTIRLCAGCGEDVGLNDYDKNQDSLNAKKLGPVSG